MSENKRWLPKNETNRTFPDYIYGEEVTPIDQVVLSRSKMSDKNFRESKKELAKFIEASKGWPDDSFASILDGAKKQALYHVLKLMLERDPESEDFEKVEELKHSQRISMMCYEGRPFAFCEWQEVKESEAPYVWITPTKYFKDEKY